MVGVGNKEYPINESLSLVEQGFTCNCRRANGRGRHGEYVVSAHRIDHDENCPKRKFCML